MAKKVRKALSPEEQTVLGNVKSLIEQLMGGGTEEQVAMAMDGPPSFEEEDEEDVMKANMGPTANPEDKAEDRVEDPTDITAGNLSEVGKSLNKLIKIMQVRNQPVRKSARPVVDNNQLVMKSLAEISTAMKAIADRQNQTDLAITNLLDGFGVVDQVAKSSSAQPVRKSAPVQNMDSTAILGELTSVLKSLGENQNQQSNNPWVHKSSGHAQLAQALPAIFGPGR